MRGDAAGPSGLRLPGGLVDLVFGLALAGAAAGLWAVAGGFEEADHTGVGPATFPRGLAALLGVSGLLLGVRGALALAGVVASDEVVTHRPLSVLLGIVLVVAFPLLMTTAGYYIAVGAWLPVFLVVAGYRKPLGILLYTAGFLAFAKVAFEIILGVRLP